MLLPRFRLVEASSVARFARTIHMVGYNVRMNKYSSFLIGPAIYGIPISLLDFLDVAARSSQHIYTQLIRAYRVPVLNTSGFLSSWDKLMFHGLCVVRRHAYIRIPYPHAQIAVYPQSSTALDISSTGHESAARTAVVIFSSVSILGSRLLALVHGMPESPTYRYIIRCQRSTLLIPQILPHTNSK